jgi:two-component system C4-dicarboxylate transport response regulator DctD
MSLAVIDVDVLLIGETGVGKELAARCLHDLGHRNEGAFVPVNCGAIPTDLVESELFGHEKGAFTNAIDQRIGKIEKADKGTLFLDEIESMPQEAQIRLLRALQERKIERLGGNQSIDVDFRVVAASKVDLREAVKQNRFREDLFYRLNVARVPVAPLRNRDRDILPIFNYYAEVMAQKFGKIKPELSRGLAERLQQYYWPGNVRELRNVAQQFVLGLELDLDEPAESLDELDFNSGFDDLVNCFEKRLILEALDRTNGKIEKTANLLKIPRKRLYLRMQKLGINKK